MRPVIALALLALAIPMVAQAAGLVVPVNQSRRLPFAGSAASVQVGSDDIAVVRVIDSRTLMVVGKKQGVTNVVVFDNSGRILFDGEVTVSASAGSTVTVYRGAEASEYSCSPFCQTAGGAAAAQQPMTSVPVVTTSAPVQAAPSAGAPTP